jgi:hypothetical protein
MKVFSQESNIRRKQIVLGQVGQRHKTCLPYLGRAGFGLSRIQAASQRCESVTRRAAKVEVQPVRSRFFGNIRNGIDSKQANHCNLNTEFLQYFAAQRRFDHIVRQGVAAWSGRIPRSRLKRPPGKAPCAFSSIAVFNEQHLRRGGALVDHHRDRPYQPLSGEQPLQEPGQPRWKQPPNEKSRPVEIRVVLDETGQPSEHPRLHSGRQVSNDTGDETWMRFWSCDADSSFCATATSGAPELKPSPEHDRLWLQRCQLERLPPLGDNQPAVNTRRSFTDSPCVFG